MAISQGGLYTGPSESFPGDEFDSFLETLLPQASNAARANITQLYPPAAAGDTLGDWERTTDFISDLMFTCNARYLARTFSNGSSYRYIFGDGSLIMETMFLLHSICQGLGIISQRRRRSSPKICKG